MKLKTNKSLKKRLVGSANRIKRGNAYKRHNQRKRPTSVKRQNREMTSVHSSHIRTIKKALPYGLE